MTKKKHEYYLRIALEEAKNALKQNACPIGAVLVDVNEEKIISKSHTQNKGEPTAHAEINVVRAIKGSFSKSKGDVIVYTTLEPCLMCVGTLVRLGIAHFVFGQRDWNMWQRSPLDISPYLRRKIKTYENINCYSNEYYELYVEYDDEEANRVFNVRI